MTPCNFEPFEADFDDKLMEKVEPLWKKSFRKFDYLFYGQIEGIRFLVKENTRKFKNTRKKIKFP